MKSRKVTRLLSIIVICFFLPNGMSFGALQPPLSRVTNPVFGTTGGIVPADVPAHLAPYVKNMTAAIQLGKALFWDMQVGSDGVTACATCHYRAGADPVVGTAPKTTAKRDKNQLHHGPDPNFGNNATIIRTFDKAAPVDPVTLLPVPVIFHATEFPRTTPPAGDPVFGPNYTLVPGDFPLFLSLPPTARLLLVNPLTGLADPVNGLTADAVASVSDTNDVIGSQGIRLADFLSINNGSAVENSNPALPTGPRQVTGRNTPPVVNAVFNYANFWDGRANNIFNGETPFGPLDQSAGIWIDNGVALVKHAIAISNSSLASQAVGPPLSPVEMSFKNRTFPELGRKMLARAPLADQFVHPKDSVLGGLSNDPNGDHTGTRGITVPGNNTYRTMVEAAFVDTLWNSAKKTTPLQTVPGPVQFDQIEANFSLFWGLAIQLYEATLVSDRAPFDRFQAGNKNAFSLAAQKGFTTFDSKCAVCHSGSEFSSAVVGSNLLNCLAPDCNRPAFTNNTTHNLIKQDVNPETFADPALIDAGFFNIGVRPTADDPGRGGTAPSGLPLSFSRLASLTGLPFVTPKLPLPLPDKVQGSFKTPILRNVELTAPYFHNGDALTLDQVVDFYTRGGNFPNNTELAAAQQPIGNLRKDVTGAGKAELVEFLNTLTDDRVRNEEAPFDHPELMIPNGVDGTGADLPLITLEATGGGPAPVPLVTFTLNPVTTPTNLIILPLSGTVDDTATVAVDVVNTTTNVTLPTAAATVGGTVAGIAGGTAQAAGDWSINLAGLTPGFNTITITATSITGGTAANPGVVNPVTQVVQITPTATISGTPSADGTKQTSAVLTIGGIGVVSYQYSLDGGAFSADRSIATAPTITLTGLADGTHTVAVLGRDVGGNLQPEANATTATWKVKAVPPSLTLNPVSSVTKKRSLTISGTVVQGSLSAVSVDTGAKGNIVQSLVSGISTWSCELTGLVAGVNTITLTALDNVFNSDSKSTSITVVVPDGKINGAGAVDVSDALRALQIVVGIVSPTSDDLLHGDVAPLANGVPAPDDKLDIADAIVILKKVAGLVTF